MQFDNQNFESGVATTMSSIQKLNDKLKMKGATDGLDDVDKSINKLSSGGLTGLSSGVEAVTAKFSALQVMAVTALANITNSAINAGKNFIKSFAIDPITDGFSEYELKMDSIQTILTNTAKHGTKLEDVNKALNELNEYSDMTIYNFAQMTDNIGKATAAGLTLEDAVIFVKGMANAAAGFGVDATRMAGATYQMTQALSAGVIKLQDWRSLEQAGMGGSLMQEEMYKVAESMGVVVDKSIPFSQSLASGWLTSEIFIKAMQNLANDPSLLQAATNVTSLTKLIGTLKEAIGSGWAQTFEHIFGDKEQSTKMWTDISDALSGFINKSAEARNAVLADWSKLGGRASIIQGLANIFTSLGKVFGAVGKAFREVFPPMTGEKLANISKAFEEFTEKIKISDEAVKQIKETFKGVFSVFGLLWDAVVGIASGFTPLLGAFKPLGSAVLTVTSTVGSFITKAVQAINKTNIFTKVGEVLGNTFRAVGNYISKVGETVSNFLGKLDFSKVGEAITAVLSVIGEFISAIGGGIGKALGSINLDTFTNLVNTIAGLGIVKFIKKLFDEFISVGDGLTGMFDSFAGIGENIKGILESTKESLTAWQNSLNATTLLKLAGAIAILAVSLTLLSSIDPSRLASALAGMGGLFAELAVTMFALQKIGNIKGVMKTSTSMILIASAVLILASAMKKLSSLNVGEMVTGLVSMAGLLGIMAAAVKLFGKSYKGLMKTSTSLIVFGAAMHVMAGALEKLGKIDAETLGGGLFALAGVLLELGAFLAVAKYGSLSISSATGILILSAALVVLAQAFNQFGSFNPDKIKKALAGIGGVLAELAIFGKVAGSGLNMIGLATGITIMAGAMLIMAKSIGAMGDLKWDEIARGLVGMAGAFTVLGVASKLISGGQMIVLSVGIGLMSTALLILGAALKSLGSMSWGEIAKSLVVLAGALTILGVAMYAMSGAIVGAGAMLVMAGALAILTPQLILLGTMSLAEIGKSLLILAGAFLVIGAAGLLLTPIVIPLLGLAAAIALLGVGCLAAGAGITMCATGLGLLAATLGVSGLVIVNFIKEIIGLIPEMATALVQGFANFVGGLATALPQMIAGFTAILTAVLTAVGTMIPQIVETGVTIAVSFAQGLATAVPQLVTAGMELIVGVLEGIAANIEQVVTAGADIVINFMDGIAAKLPEIIESGINLALSFIEGVADGISNNKDRIEAAVEKAITAMIDAALAVITGSVTAIKEKGREFLQGMVDGIKEKWEAAKKAVSDAIDKAKEGAKNCGKKLLQAGKDLIQGFINGINEKIEAAKKAIGDGVQACVDKAKSVLGIKSPSRVFMEIGRYTAEGFAVGLDRTAGRASDSAANLANSVIDNVKEPLSNLSKILDVGINTDPVIRPVMDLSNVKQGARMLDGMLQNNDMQINGISGTLAGTIGTIQNGNDNSDIVTALKDLKDSLGNNGPSYTINGITYDDGSNVVNAVETLVRAARIERRI